MGQNISPRKKQDYLTMEEKLKFIKESAAGKTKAPFEKDIPRKKQKYTMKKKTYKLSSDTPVGPGWF